MDSPRWPSLARLQGTHVDRAHQASQMTGGQGCFSSASRRKMEIAFSCGRWRKDLQWDDLLSRCRNQLHFNIRCAGWSNIYGRAQFFVFAEKVGIHVGESPKIFPGEEFVFPGYSWKERETATLICNRRSVQV